MITVFNDIIKPIRKKKKRLLTLEVKKTAGEPNKHLAFGWASIAADKNGVPIEDYHNDIIPIEELEEAVYSYIEDYSDGGEEHIRGGVAHIVESVVFTDDKIKALELPENSIHRGWWIGMRVTDEEVWEKVKEGTYHMFSIEGEAIRD